MTALRLDNLGVEHDVGSGHGASTKILLPELLNLGLDGSASLDGGVSSRCRWGIVSTTRKKASYGATYQLFLQGNLLELHLVNFGLGKAGQGSRRDERALHDGQRLKEIICYKNKVGFDRSKLSGYVLVRFFWLLKTMMVNVVLLFGEGEEEEKATNAELRVERVVVALEGVDDDQDPGVARLNACWELRQCWGAGTAVARALC